MAETKKLILITSPPACGKTRLAKRLSEKIGNVVYLDKDSVIPLSHRIFSVAHKPFNRSSKFFNTEIREYEYEAILNIALLALNYNDRVILNAPFTSEVREEEPFRHLKHRLSGLGAELVVVWIQSNADICYARMKKRNSERDGWKLSHWEEYVKGVNFAPPENLGDSLLLYDGTSDEKGEESFDVIYQKLKR